MNSILLPVLNYTAIVATAVVFGTDVFFFLVGKKASAKSKDASVADVIGHFHEIADARMPFIGVTAIFTTLTQVIVAGLHTSYGWLATVSLVSLLAHLAVYLTVARPINKLMIEGVKFGRLIPDIRELQQRWDRVIGLRAALLFIAVTALVALNYY